MTGLKDSLRRVTRKLGSVLSSVKRIRTRTGGEKTTRSQREHRYFT